MYLERYFQSRAYLCARNALCVIVVTLVITIVGSMTYETFHKNQSSPLWLSFFWLPIALLLMVGLVLFMSIPYLGSEEFSERHIFKVDITTVAGRAIERTKRILGEDELGNITTHHGLLVELEIPKGIKNPEELEKRPLPFFGAEAYGLVSRDDDRVSVVVTRGYDRKGHILKISYKLKPPAD